MQRAKVDLVQCLTCQNYTLTTSKLRGHGLGNCSQGPKWEFPSPIFERQCETFTRATEEAVQARINWWDGKGTQSG